MAEAKPTEYLDGWHAHKNGFATEQNPYKEGTQSISNMRWLSGWCGRFNALKHGRPTAELDEQYD